MNLGTGRIVIIAALVVAGIVVLSQGFPDDSGTAAIPSPTITPTPTETPSPTGETGGGNGGQAEPTPEPNTTGVAFMALNGTSVTGAGAGAQELLEADGYVAPADAADSPVQGASVTTVYFRPGADADQNKADATYVSEHYFDGEADVSKLTSVFDEIVPRSAAFVIVVGDDFAEQLTSGA